MVDPVCKIIFKCLKKKQFIHMQVLNWHKLIDYNLKQFSPESRRNFSNFLKLRGINSFRCDLPKHFSYPQEEDIVNILRANKICLKFE